MAEFRIPGAAVQAAAAGAAVIAGGAGLLYALFGPTIHTVTVTSDAGQTSSSHSLVQDGIPAVAAIVIALVGVLILAAALSALLDLRGVRAARMLLNLFTALLVAVTLFLMLTIGYLFLPSIALLLLAAFAAARRAQDGGGDRTAPGSRHISRVN